MTSAMQKMMGSMFGIDPETLQEQLSGAGEQARAIISTVLAQLQRIEDQNMLIAEQLDRIENRLDRIENPLEDEVCKSEDS